MAFHIILQIYEFSFQIMNKSAENFKLGIVDFTKCDKTTSALIDLG